ncbi:unnamed protein product [Mycena citricolor]|uniref:Chromatin modification-related protein EAF3 n=1 Tax=Mycena citricolor TaxID=2018698 RepID=A0AAD2Q1D3_9AGAR|nr:unnamed protein product [Mycena citricolor]
MILGANHQQIHISLMDTPTFTVGENVLCYHGPLIYVAKVLKAQTAEPDEKNTITGQDGQHYFVHYKGWKTTWDEWVPAARLLKDNEQNRITQKSVQKEESAKTSSNRANQKSSTAGAAKDILSASVASASTRSARKETATRGTKRGRDAADGARAPDMKLNVPEQIKAKLVDDYETVTKDNKLVTLPRNPSVGQLLKDFEKYLTETPPPHLKDPNLLAPTVISGLQVYFDRSLANHLLYRVERPQYTQIRAKYITGQAVVIGQEKEMSEIYGAEHLLRMLVILPAMVSQSTLDGESVDIVREYVNELLAWMLQEQSRLFLPEYAEQSIAYQNVARS